MKKMLILGANNPEVVRLFECFKEANLDWKLVGFLDNDPQKKGGNFIGYKVFGGYEVIKQEAFKDCYVVNAITRDCRTRKMTTDQLLSCGAKLTNLIHPNVNLSYVKYGKGLFIQESVILQADVIVEDNVAINMGSLIGHESFIGESTFIAPGCTISGSVKIANGVLIGTGTTIVPRIKIGEWSIIGTGSVVIRDVEPFTVVAGNPARVIRRIKNE